MKDKFVNILGFLKSLPLWLRLSLIALVAIFMALMSFTSCGPVVRVSAKSTTDTVTISVSQNVTDSTGVSVSVNPNISINPKNGYHEKDCYH